MNINILVIALGIKNIDILKNLKNEKFNFFYGESFLDIIDIIYKESIHCIVFSDFRGKEATSGYIKMFKKTNPHIKLVILTENIYEFDDLKSYYIQKEADIIIKYDNIITISNFFNQIWEEVNNIQDFNSKWHDLTNKFLKFIKFNYNNPRIIKEFQKESGYSYTTIIHYVKDDTGKNCNKLINETRIQHAITLISNTNYPLKYISEKVGFASVQGFIKAFKNFIGTSPSKFRQKYFTNRDKIPKLK